VVSTKVPVTKPEPDAKSRQRSRSIAIAWGLVALIVLFYLITIFKMGGSVVSRAI
jgi:hypothetical protein